MDIRVEVSYGGSPWSRTNTIVEITHLPTGIKTKCSKHRGAHYNRAEALEELNFILETNTDFLKQMSFDF